VQRDADRFARSDDATKEAATEKYGAAMVNAILAIAKNGITSETMGAVMGAAGQLKESAKNASAAVAGAFSGAVKEVANDAAKATKTMGTIAGGAVRYLTGNETERQTVADDLNDKREENVKNALGFATMVPNSIRSTVVNVVGKTVRGEVEKKAEALSNSPPMLGAGGTKIFSSTVWKGEGKARLDVENPNPGQRPGQIHFQDNTGNKYMYDTVTKSFPTAPNSVNKLLSDPGFAQGIQKGLKYLGEKQ
jgi:hypothetical protein